jgi:cell division transport system permease protein
MIAPRIASALRRTARIACERPRLNVWTLVALTAAMFAVGIAALAADHVDRWTRDRHGSASMVVYLGEGIDETRAQALAVELAKLRGIERAELVPAAQSAARLQQALGADSALLEGIELSSLPASVEVTLAPGMRDVIAMSPTLRALEGSPAVDDIVVEDGGSERLVRNLATLRSVAWIGAALFAALALLVALATIRVRFERDERELAVAHLLGASPTFLFVPTAFAGALHGAAAALLALVAVALGIHVYGDAIATSLTSALGTVHVALPDPITCLMFITLGALLGLVGGGFAGAAGSARATR